MDLNYQGLHPRLQRILFWSRSGASKALFKRVKIWSQRSMQKTFQILYLTVFRYEPNSSALNAIFFYFISSRDCASMRDTCNHFLWRKVKAINQHPARFEPTAIRYKAYALSLWTNRSVVAVI